VLEECVPDHRLVLEIEEWGMEFSHNYAVLDDVKIHYVTGGEGLSVLLLHGFPQTWRAWRHIMPNLVDGGYRVIAPDLRGLGDSTRPLSGYDKKTIANDVWRLVDGVLGINAFFVVGHDWGGPIAFALACAHRDEVRKLAIIDVTIPGDGTDTFATSQNRWHHLFFRTPDLPEALIEGRERIFFTWFFRNFGYRPDSILDEDIEDYLRCYSTLGALRSGLAYYRATPQDIADNERSIREFGMLKMPVLALGGTKSFGRGVLVKESLARLAENVEGGVIEEAGHWIPEEQPQELTKRLLSFFGRA
jgi:pimeloyl-ACP methyl ester carboxylesterase